MAVAPDISSAIMKLDSVTLSKAVLRAPLASLDYRLAGVDPWKVVVGTAGVTLTLAYMYSLTQGRVTFTNRIKKKFFKLMRKLPAVRNKIETEMQKVKTSFEAEFQSAGSELETLHSLPDKGLDQEQIITEITLHLELGDLDVKGGAMSGTLYNSSQELSDLMTQVYGMAAWSNPLHPDAFPGLRKIEAEVVRICCDIFHGKPDSCGTVTTGGTESIVLACKAYRDLARDKTGLEVVDILCPITAHAAFDKAADILGMRIKHVPVDEVTCRVDVNAMRRMITKSTAMLVGSVPQFPHGSIDGIEEIAELGIKYDVPVHVDCCLGGFLAPFMEEAGFPIKPFDFRVSGVTSISADTHKYGYAPKGSSVVLYSNKVYRDYQWFCFPDWPGGIYATPTIGGSRAGGIVVACWAAMRYFGREGYVSATRDIITTTRFITQALRDIPGLDIIGVPDVSVVAFGSKKFNIYGLSDGLKSRGWALNALQFPTCVHLCVTRVHTAAGIADKFVNDVKEVTESILADPESSEAGSAAMYGMAASLPDRSIVEDITGLYLDALYTLKPAAV